MWGRSRCPTRGFSGSPVAIEWDSVDSALRRCRRAVARSRRRRTGERLDRAVGVRLECWSCCCLIGKY